MSKGSYGVGWGDTGQDGGSCLREAKLQDTGEASEEAEPLPQAAGTSL